MNTAATARRLTLDPARPGLIFLLALCAALGPMCVNIFLPALPQIQSSLGVSIAAAQSTVSAYLLAFAISILLAGPLADRFGRRSVIIGGMAICTLGSVICALAPSLQILVIGRVVQAMGAACGVTVARAVVGDLYRGEELARRMAMLTMAMMLGTTTSPLVGGELAARLGWHSTFVFMALLGILAVTLCSVLLPETRVFVAAGSRQMLWQESRKVIAKPVFFGYVLQAGAIYAIFVAFISIAPYVMQNVLNRPATSFGIWYMLLSLGYFLGNFYVSRGASGVSPDRQMMIGLGIQMVAAAAALLFATLHYWEPWFIFGPMLPLAFGQGLSLPHITSHAVQLAPGYSGLAAAMIGFSQQAIAGLSVQAMGFARTDTPMPIMWFCAVASALGFASVFLLRSRDSQAV